MTEQELRHWLNTAAPEEAPATLRYRVAGITAAAPARGWGQAWLANRRLAWLVVATALLMAALIALAIVGAAPRRTPPLPGSTAHVNRFEWSPDGSMVAVEVSGKLAEDAITKPYSALYVVNQDGSNLRQIDRLEQAATYGSLGDWSPDSTSIIWNDEVVPVGGEQPTGLPTDSSIPKKWSPSGDRIGYLVYNENGGSDLFVASPDGADVGRLTSNGLITDFWWSPGSDRILYDQRSDAVVDVGTTDAAWVMNPDGSGKLKVADGSVAGAGWSRDGTRISMLSQDPATFAVTYWSVAPDGSDRQVQKIGPTDPRLVSPDGTVFLDYGSNDDGSGGIVLRDPSGATTQLTTDPNDLNPRWSDDGAWIAFQGTRPEGTGLFVVPSSGGDAQFVAANAWLAFGLNSGWWQPGSNGAHRLAFVRDGGLVTVNVDGSGLSDLVPMDSISERAIIGSPAGQQFDERMVISDDGPDRDVYHLPISSTFEFTIENRTNNIWDFWFDENWFYHPDCRAESDRPRLLAAIGVVDGSFSAEPQMDVEPCLVPAHGTVHISLPHAVDGAIQATIVPWDDINNRDTDGVPYRRSVATFDFLPQN